MLISTLVADAAAELNDTGFARHAKAALIGFADEAQKMLALALPRATVVTAVMRLAANETRQSLPTAGQEDPDGNDLLPGLTLFKVVRNMGADGKTRGDAVRLISGRDLDLFDPSWRSRAGSRVVRHYQFDERTPARFEVYPAAHASTPVWVEADYSAMPETLTGEGDEFLVPEIYRSPILHWMLYRALSVDTESATARRDKDTHYRAFYTELGLKPPATAMESPKNPENA